MEWKLLLFATYWCQVGGYVVYFERIRDMVAEPFSSDVIRQRAAAGGIELLPAVGSGSIAHDR